MLVPMTLSDLERRDARGQFLSAGSLLIALEWFDLYRMTKFGSGQPLSHPQRPPNFGTPTCVVTVSPRGMKFRIRHVGKKRVSRG